MNQEIETTGAQKSASNQKPLLMLGVAALVILLVFGCLAAGTLLIIDPFNFHIIDRLTGRWDAAAEAMPEDTVMYMGVNLLNMTPQKLERVLTPFQNLVVEETGEPVATLEDIKTQLDADVLSELDMTFAEDIQPWIGQYLGLGLVDFQMGKYGELETVDFVGSVEVRNSKAADAFLEKLRLKISENTGGAFVETTYRGVTLAELTTSSELDQIAFARSGNLLIFSNHSRNLKRAIDSQGEASLAVEPVFKQLVGKLPKERILNLYIAGDRLTELLRTSAPTLGGMGAAESAQYLGGLAMSISIVDAGIQIDSWVAYDPEKMSEEQKKMTATTGEKLTLAENLPAGTLFYLGGVHLDQVWLANKATLAQTTGMGEDWDAAMDLFAQEYGFNPDTDLLPYLDGEWGLAILPAEDGILAQQMKIPIGVLLAMDTSNSEKVAGVVNDFASSLRTMGTPVVDVPFRDTSLKQLSDPMMGPVFTFGLADERLVLATSSGMVGMLTEDQETLADAARYQQVVKALPRGVAPTLYLDLEKMFDDIRSNLSDEFLGTFEESVNYLQPIQYVILGNSAVQKNLAHSVAIIFIQQK